MGDVPGEDLADAGPHRDQKQPGQDLTNPAGQPAPGRDIDLPGTDDAHLPPGDIPSEAPRPGDWPKEDRESDVPIPVTHPPGKY